MPVSYQAQQQEEHPATQALQESQILWKILTRKLAKSKLMHTNPYAFDDLIDYIHSNHVNFRIFPCFLVGM